MNVPDLPDASGGVILDGPFDPDAQATVTDYIDYTEYLPADIIRSLTLIRGLDERSLQSAQAVHELTTTYGHLPDLPADERPNARALRRDISAQLDRAINARHSAYAEACRIYDVVDRHFVRLGCIRQKLEALPKPASREPTPPPTLSASKRRSATKKDEDNKPAAAPTTRITLRLDKHDPTRSQKSRTRRSVLAAEHLAGLHPDSPIASTEQSDVDGDSQEGPSEELEDEPVHTPAKKEKQSSRRARTSASSGAQAISTSNALALLRPPPDDAKPGSEDMPWLRLTEWEMTKLRKKMKKNSVWKPSEVMIHRELALRGRGWEAYRAAKAEAEATGTELVDCDDIPNTYVPGTLMLRSEATNETEHTIETKLSNRGMKLNEAKKLKRENQAREQAAAAAAAVAAGAEPSSVIAASTATTTTEPAPDSTKSNRTSRKRKLEPSPVEAVTAAPVPAPAPAPAPPSPEVETRPSLRSSAKRRKTSKDESPSPPGPGPGPDPEPTVVTTTTSTTVPLADDDDARRTPQRTSPPARPKRSSSVAAATRTKEMARTATPPLSTRPPSRRRSAAASAEPISSTTASAAGREVRRKSATPARRTPVPETNLPTRRRKRPAPGPVSSGQNGGAAVSYGRRKAKPTKKRVGVREPGVTEGPLSREDVRIDEDGVLEEIDPSEPRYCVCQDVSFGTMICCENQDCDKEWFHLGCVGLSEVPSRTAKWYCPDCRVKLNKGAHGIVKTGLRR